ncbi:MAG: hypothetical protein HYU27_09370, partial [Acidobacteria bacterium]|nr:hypothetical protein [Acidobacteriota bacterium]
MRAQAFIKKTRWTFFLFLFAAGCLTRSAVAQAPVPVLNTISPNFGSPNTFVTVELTGSNFASPATVAVSGDGVTVVGNPTVTPAKVTATLAIRSSASLGYRQISYGTSNSRTFTILAASAPPPAPVLSSISLSFGAPGQQLSNVILAGTNFVPEPAVAVSGDGVTATTASVTPTSWTGTFTIATNAASGIRNVSRQQDTTTDANGRYKFIFLDVVPCNDFDSRGVALTYSKRGYKFAVRPSSENQDTQNLFITFITAGEVPNVDVALAPYKTGPTDYKPVEMLREFVKRSDEFSSDVVTFPAGTFQQDDILFLDVIAPDGAGDVNFGVTLHSGTGLGTVELMTANKAGLFGHAQLYGEFTNSSGSSMVSGSSHFGFSPRASGQSSVSTDIQVNTDTGTTNWITGSFSLTLHHSTASGSNPRRFLWQIVRLSRQGVSPPATPVLNTISPNFGSAGEFVEVTLTGANFVPGLSTVLSEAPDVTVTSVNVLNSNTMNATLAIGSTAAPGYRQLAVRNLSGLESPPLVSDTRTFTVLPASVPAAAPTLSAISRDGGNPGERIYVTLTGTNFMPESTVEIVPAQGITVTSLTVLNATTMTAWLVIDPAAISDIRFINVRTPGVGTSASLPFTVRAPIIVTGSVMSITPAAGAPGTTLSATIRGTTMGPNLSAATAVTFSGSGITATIGSGATEISLPITITIAPGATTGLRTVTVTTAVGLTTTFSGFTIANQSALPVTWKMRAPLVDPRTGSGVEGAAASLIGNKIYVSHGYRNGDTALFSIYDLSSDTWAHGAPSSTAPDATVIRSEMAGGTALGRH